MTTEERKYVSTELPKAFRVAGRFKEWLRDNGIKFEASEAGNMIHFEVYATETEMAEANAFIDTLDDYEDEFFERADRISGSHIDYRYV